MGVDDGRNFGRRLNQTLYVYEGLRKEAETYLRQQLKETSGKVGVISVFKWLTQDKKPPYFTDIQAAELLFDLRYKLFDIKISGEKIANVEGESKSQEFEMNLDEFYQAYDKEDENISPEEFLGIVNHFMNGEGFEARDGQTLIPTEIVLVYDYSDAEEQEMFEEDYVSQKIQEIQECVIRLKEGYNNEPVKYDLQSQDNQQDQNRETSEFEEWLKKDDVKRELTQLYQSLVSVRKYIEKFLLHNRDFNNTDRKLLSMINKIDFDSWVDKTKALAEGSNERLYFSIPSLWNVRSQYSFFYPQNTAECLEFINLIGYTMAGFYSWYSQSFDSTMQMPLAKQPVRLKDEIQNIVARQPREFLLDAFSQQKVQEAEEGVGNVEQNFGWLDTMKRDFELSMFEHLDNPNITRISYMFDYIAATLEVLRNLDEAEMRKIFSGVDLAFVIGLLTKFTRPEIGDTSLDWTVDIKRGSTILVLAMQACGLIIFKDPEQTLIQKLSRAKPPLQTPKKASLFQKEFSIVVDSNSEIYCDIKVKELNQVWTYFLGRNFTKGINLAALELYARFDIVPDCSVNTWSDKLNILKNWEMVFACFGIIQSRIDQYKYQKLTDPSQKEIVITTLANLQGESTSIKLQSAWITSPTRYRDLVEHAYHDCLRILSLPILELDESQTYALLQKHKSELTEFQRYISRKLLSSKIEITSDLQAQNVIIGLKEDIALWLKRVANGNLYGYYIIVLLRNSFKTISKHRTLIRTCQKTSNYPKKQLRWCQSRLQK